MFSSVELILKINEELLGVLEKRMKEWNDQCCLGDIFLQFVSS